MNKKQYDAVGIFLVIITIYIWIFHPIPTHLVGEYGDVTRAPAMFEVIYTAILFAIGKITPPLAILFFVLGRLEKK